MIRSTMARCADRGHGSPAATGADLSPPVLEAKPAREHSLQVESSLLLVSEFLQSGKWAGLPCLGPHDCGVQCSSDLSFPRACVLFLSVPLPGAQVLTWQLLFLSYPVTCGSFLQPCWPRSLFASLWFVFSENSSICR